MYLNINHILSYNSSLNFVVLKRGYGKTYAFKDYIIRQHIKDQSQAIWLRRYKTEIKRDMIEKFFDDIKHRYNTHKFELKNKTWYMDNKPLLYFMPLSTAQSYKSVPYPQVKVVVYDEFLIESGSFNYLQNEPSVLSSFMHTVFRDRPVKMFLLGNKTKLVTPYNLYFNVADFIQTKFYPDRKILIYSVDNDDTIEKNYATSDIEKILRGTDYYDYSFKNQSLDDTNAYIKVRPPNLQNQFVININSIDLGVYIDNKEGRIYFDLNCDKTIKKKFCYNSNNLQESYFLLSNQNPLTKLIKKAYEDGRVYYQNIRSKEIAIAFINCII